MSGHEVLMLAWDHTTHHRGQLIVYLRLKGNQARPTISSEKTASITVAARLAAPAAFESC